LRLLGTKWTQLRRGTCKSPEKLQPWGVGGLIVQNTDGEEVFRGEGLRSARDWNSGRVRGQMDTQVSWPWATWELGWWVRLRQR
jgi:hypothetical protein